MVLPVGLISALRCMAWDSCVNSGGLMEIIFLRVDETDTDFGVALACFMLSPFSVLFQFSNLTGRIQ